MSSSEVPHLKTPRIEPFPQTGPEHILSNRGSVLLDNRGCCCTTRCMLISAFLTILVLCTALIVVTVEVRKESDADDDSLFDEFFRTPEEQAEYEKRLLAFEEKLSTTGFIKSTDRCSFRCSSSFQDADEGGRQSQTTTRGSLEIPTRPPSDVIRNETSPVLEGSGSLDINESFSRSKRQAVDVSTYPPVRHACCVSRMLFITPSEAKNVYHERLIVIQANGYNQYFKSYNCSHVEGCTGCGCCQSVEHHRAVVRRPNKRHRFVALIILPGCCKCYNNLDPNNC